MIIEVDQEEWWPIYEIHEKGLKLDLPEDKVQWLNRIFKEFQEGQNYLREEYKKVGEKKTEARNKGIAAASSGLNEDANPYYHDTWQFEEWEFGWQDWFNSKKHNEELKSRIAEIKAKNAAKKWPPEPESPPI